MRMEVVQLRFIETNVKGAYLIEFEPIVDERGFFARSWCKGEFEAHGLNTQIVQVNTSFNKETGTLRGLHYQTPPCEEAKLVQCTKGAIYDVILDLRSCSPTYLRWTGGELTENNHHMLYVPEGCAHGFQVIQDQSVVSYMVTQYYSRSNERGIRWNDPTFNIEWPLPVTLISQKDASYPNYEIGKNLELYREN